jgi:uncharacterized protein RhaS with RHS repeats
MQQRYYDPIAGRFLSVDPLTTDTATGTGFGRYHYGANNPLRYIDPDGLCEVPTGSHVCGSASSNAAAGCMAAFVSAANDRIATGLNSVVRSAVNLVSAGARQSIGVLAITPLGIAAGNILSEGAEISTSKEPPVPGATPGRETKGRTTQWNKGGGMEEANRDFDAKSPKDVTPLPDGGRRGTLPDGRQINVRPNSSGEGLPTLEIQNGKNRDKVRYGP